VFFADLISKSDSVLAICLDLIAGSNSGIVLAVNAATLFTAVAFVKPLVCYSAHSHLDL
jgi:hypothetical protein